MFLICWTSKPHPINLESFAVKQWGTASGTLTLAWSGPLATFLERPGGFVLSEGLPLGNNGCERFVHSLVTYDGPTESLELESKPDAGATLYYCGDAAGSLYCSSHISLLRSAGVALEENRELLPDYFTYRYVTPPHTLYKGIFQLAKGSLRVEANGSKRSWGREKRYDAFPQIDDGAVELEEAVDSTLDILSSFFESLRPYAERLAVPLSGGMDSSVLFRLAQRKLGLSTSYSTGYPFESERDNLERRYALTAAEALGSEHHYYASSTGEYLEAVVRAIAAAEEPIHHHQTAMIYLLYAGGIPAQKEVLVLGTGAGGVFGTPLQGLIHDYNEHRLVRKALYGVLCRPPLRQTIASASRAFRRGRRVVKKMQLRGRLGLPLDHPRHLVWSADAYGSPAWIQDHFGVAETALRTSRRDLLQACGRERLLEQIALIDLFDKTQFLWAKIALAQGRVACFPFMREELQKHLFRVPWSLRLAASKRVLAEVARRLEVPEFILNRGKSGFGVRRRDWARPGSVFDPLVPLAAKVVDRRELQALQSRDSEKAMTFWNLINYALWKRLFIDNEPVEALIGELREQLQR